MIKDKVFSREYNCRKNEVINLSPNLHHNKKQAKPKISVYVVFNTQLIYRIGLALNITLI